MLIAVIGGKLQGVEAVYLAKKAGFETLVIDRKADAPATGLCDRFLEFEFSLEHPVPQNCPEVDLILPALEDMEALTAVKVWAEMKNIPLAFDLDAYTLSTSKLKSDLLFRKMKLPAPAAWPECSFPVVVKPDESSGSQGVEIVKDSKALSAKFPDLQKPDNMVIQEYLEGLSYSIEVMGRPGRYQALQVTDLGMDKDYDCNRITAPTKLSSHHIRQFEEMAVAIAEEIHLNGLMDVEVVLNDNQLKILEIDARIPSQTPMTVYWSTGINMVKMLADLFLKEKTPKIELKSDQESGQEPDKKSEQFSLVEHVQVSGSKIEVLGEHIMSGQGPLAMHRDFFGAKEAITSFSKGKKQWVATLIFSAESRDEVNAEHRNCHDQIREFTRSIRRGESIDPFKNQ